MIAELQVEEAWPPVWREDPVAYIIFELLPRFAEACGEGASARWRRRSLIAEVNRLCAEHGLQEYGA